MALWSSSMILPLGIWVYNLEEVLGSIPSEALFSFFCRTELCLLYDQSSIGIIFRRTEIGPLAVLLISLLRVPVVASKAVSNHLFMI